jgi:hypothetical protein
LRFYHMNEPEQGETTCRYRILHAFRVALAETRNEFLQDRVLQLGVLMTNQMYRPCHKPLLILELLIRNLHIVLLGLQQWLNEPQQLISNLMVI